VARAGGDRAQDEKRDRATRPGGDDCAETEREQDATERLVASMRAGDALHRSLRRERRDERRRSDRGDDREVLRPEQALGIRGADREEERHCGPHGSGREPDAEERPAYLHRNPRPLRPPRFALAVGLLG